MTGDVHVLLDWLPNLWWSSRLHERTLTIEPSNGCGGKCPAPEEAQGTIMAGASESNSSETGTLWKEHAL